MQYADILKLRSIYQKEWDNWAQEGIDKGLIAGDAYRRADEILINWAEEDNEE